MLSKHGYRMEDLIKEITEKIRVSLYYKKYRSSLEKNKKELETGKELLEDPFERRLLIEIPQRDFEDFFKVIGNELREIANNI